MVGKYDISKSFLIYGSVVPYFIYRTLHGVLDSQKNVIK